MYLFSDNPRPAVALTDIDRQQLRDDLDYVLDSQDSRMTDLVCFVISRAAEYVRQADNSSG